MPEYAYAVYLIVADDDNSNNFAWDISTPYVPVLYLLQNIIFFIFYFYIKFRTT